MTDSKEYIKIHNLNEVKIDSAIVDYYLFNLNVSDSSQFIQILQLLHICRYVVSNKLEYIIINLTDYKPISNLESQITEYNLISHLHKYNFIFLTHYYYKRENLRYLESHLSNTDFENCELNVCMFDFNTAKLILQLYDRPFFYGILNNITDIFKSLPSAVVDTPLFHSDSNENYIEYYKYYNII